MKAQILQQTVFDQFLVQTYYPQGKSISMPSHSEAFEENLLKSEKRRFDFDATPIKCLICWAVCWGFVILADSWSRNTNSADWHRGYGAVTLSMCIQVRREPLPLLPVVSAASGNREMHSPALRG